MHITRCETDDQCKSMHEAGHSKLVLWGNPEGWGGEGGGRGIQEVGGHMYTCDQFMLVYDKNQNIVIIFQLKLFN